MDLVKCNVEVEGLSLWRHLWAGRKVLQEQKIECFIWWPVFLFYSQEYLNGKTKLQTTRWKSYLVVPWTFSLATPLSRNRQHQCNRSLIMDCILLSLVAFWNTLKLSKGSSATLDIWKRKLCSNERWVFLCARCCTNNGSKNLSISKNLLYR